MIYGHTLTTAPGTAFLSAHRCQHSAPCLTKTCVILEDACSKKDV